MEISVDLKPKTEALIKKKRQNRLAQITENIRGLTMCTEGCEFES